MFAGDLVEYGIVEPWFDTKENTFHIDPKGRIKWNADVSKEMANAVLHNILKEIQQPQAKRQYLTTHRVFIRVTPAGRRAIRELRSNPERPSDDDQWAPAAEIVKLGYVQSKSALTKLAKKHPEIRRAATDDERIRFGNKRLYDVYNKRRIYELTEGRAGN